MNVLHRIWTGIVAAVTGAALALLIQIIGLLTIKMPIEWLTWILAACSTLGFIIGVLVGPRTTKPSEIQTPPQDLNVPSSQ